MGNLLQSPEKTQKTTIIKYPFLIFIPIYIKKIKIMTGNHNYIQAIMRAILCHRNSDESTKALHDCI